MGERTNMRFSGVRTSYEGTGQDEIQWCQNMLWGKGSRCDSVMSEKAMRERVKMKFSDARTCYGERTKMRFSDVRKSYEGKGQDEIQ